MNKITAASADKMTAAPKAPKAPKGLRTWLLFQKYAAVGTSTRRNRNATTAAQITDDRDQIRKTTANRFKMGNFLSLQPT